GNPRWQGWRGFSFCRHASAVRPSAEFKGQETGMSDLDSLKSSLLAEIAAAGDEASIEAVRVSALGKKGSVSELLKTLGTMTPEERQTRGAAINALKNEV